MPSQSTSLAAAASTTVLLGLAWLMAHRNFRREKGQASTIDVNSLPSIVGSESDSDNSDDSTSEGNPTLDLEVLPCIRNRRSIFPNGFKKNPPPLDEGIVRSLLDAALYGPFHGKCFAGNRHPAKFVVLGKESMVNMQLLTLQYYDTHWKDLGCWSSEEEYQSFRKSTEDEITGRWAPVSCMIAVVMRRQSGPRRFPEWEEAAAVACAVQNMHIQSTRFKQLACYWSSWHDAARDCVEMKRFLDMGDEDKCMGFFIVAQAKNPDFQVRRTRDPSLMDVEWRS